MAAQTLTAGANNVTVGSVSKARSVWVKYNAVKGGLTETGEIIVQNNENLPPPVRKWNFDDTELETVPLGMAISGDDLILIITLAGDSDDIEFYYNLTPIKI